MSDEEKYLEIREKLRSLETVKASSDFTNKLHLKIVEEESSRRKEHIKKYDDEKGGFLRNLFNNRQYPWLIPAVGFAMVIFFVFYVTYISRDNMSVDEQKTSTDTEQGSVENKDLAGIDKNQKQKNIQTEVNESNSEKNIEKKNGKEELKNEENKPAVTETDNKKKVNTQNPDLAFVETESNRTATSKSKKITENKSLPELKIEKEEEKTSEVTTDEAFDETSDETFGNEMAMPQTTSKPDSESPVIEKKRETFTADEGGGNGLSIKLNKINKTYLENIRNEIIK